MDRFSDPDKSRQVNKYAAYQADFDYEEEEIEEEENEHE